LNEPKLLFISTEFPPGPGGIGTQAYHLARGLSDLGWRVAALSPQDYAAEDEIRRWGAAQSFRIVRQQHRRSAALEGAGRLRDLARLSREFGPDILLASGARAVWLAALYAGSSRRPWAAIAHGGIEFGTPVRWQRLISRWAYSQPQAVVCVSDYARGRMLALGARPRRVEVITNGADECAFRPLDAALPQALRREWGLEEAQILLTVGSLSERKGQEIVIRALPAILAARPNVHYVMVGLPQIQDKLERLAQELGVRSQVHFLGRVDQATLVAAYNACDLFIMTSRRSANGDAEGYGIAVIEAALCGKPAVVSGESGLAEAVIAEQTGLLVPENDPQATAQAVLRLLGDDDLRARLGGQARQRALSEQTWSSRAARYDQLLREILGLG
jgi:phosphatidylinositol alpha-1,6-mannosyltransferase